MSELRKVGRVFHNTDLDKIVIDAEPHVMSKVRALFKKSQKGDKGNYTHKTIWLSPTMFNFRDVDWIMERYPMECEQSYLDKIKGESKKYDDMYRDVSNADKDFNLKLSPKALEMSVALRDHQISFNNMAKKVKRMLLADKMGLGKTIASLSLLVEPERRPALIIVPPTLCTQWQNVIKEVIPDLTTHVIRGFKNYELPSVEVLITSYNRLAPWQDTLNSIHFPTIIADEIHELRHTNTAKRSAIQSLAENAGMFLGLSGTPIFNYGSEIWSVLDVISPGCLGDQYEFLAEWCDSWDRTVHEPSTLNSFLKNQGLMLRRTPEEVGLVFGKLSKTVCTIDSDLKELEKVQNVAKTLALSVLSGNINDAAESSRELDWKLRHATGVAKAKPAAEFVKMLLEEEQKVVVTVWHRDCFIKDTKILMYDGSVKNVQDIVVGDLLMGPDSKPRKVKSTFSDFGETVKVIPKKGDSFVCSSGHIITSEYNSNKKIKHIKAKEMLSMSDRNLLNYKLMRSENIVFPNSTKIIEPWLIGYWIGDGAKNLKDLRVSSKDSEIWKELDKIAVRHGLIVRKWQSKGASRDSKCLQLCLSTGTNKGSKNRNNLLNYFRDLKLDSKHIPHIIKTSSLEDRANILAGLIDSDGHVYKNACGVDFVSINLSLAEDVAFLCRSIGLAAYIKNKKYSKSGYSNKEGEYFKVQISGDLSKIPTKIERKKSQKRKINKRVNRVGFELKQDIEQKYYGFEVDGDNLFLLSDFTIVHNCYDILMKELKQFNPVMYSGSETVAQKEKSLDKFINGDSRVFLISLRSGAGIDGLQKSCNTIVHAELDWSPHVMDQLNARLDRDGQTNHVNAYYLTIPDGADPFMIQTLNVKRSQHDGLIEGKTTESEVMDNQADSNRIKKLAEAYLKSIGEEIPEAVEETGFMKDVAEVLRTIKLPHTSEDEMQEALDEYLKLKLPDAIIEREYKVTKRSRLDFLVTRGEERVAIECKINALKRADVYRQVRRYAEEIDVNAVMLVAPWNGVPSFVVDKTPVVVVDTSISAL